MPDIIKRLGVIIDCPEDAKPRDNVTGATVLEWRSRLTGRRIFQIYFAGHKARHIRLAESRELLGPYKLRRFPIAMLTRFSRTRRGHVSSPEIYYVGKKKYLITHAVPKHPEISQLSYISRLWFSRFTPKIKRLDLPSYARAFIHQGRHFVITRAGKLFEVNPKLEILRKTPISKRNLFEKNERDNGKHIRHPMVANIQGRLICFYTCIGDTPERVFASEILDLEGEKPYFSRPIEIIRPELPYEGADLPITPSTRGSAKRPVNQLRDPYFFTTENKSYLFYSVKGEFGIALCEIDSAALLTGLGSGLRK